MRILKFGIAGFFGLIIDFGVTYLLKEKIKINKFIANSLGFLFAVINNFFINKYWTFKSTNPQIMVEFLSFFCICTVGLLLTNIILYLLNEKLKYNFYISKICSILFVMIWNFSAVYFITFKS
nr:GtrA family protein [Sphingobacterium multivorum]